MEKMFFVLNNSISVDAPVNLLTHLETGTQVKLEPRLIALLCLLANANGQLVSRETLIATIWDNYGGAEDALHQGISILRKALGDSTRQIIETVPKKGYILHATITDHLPVPVQQTQPTNKVRRIYLTALLCGVILVLSLLLLLPGKTDLSEPSAKIPTTVSSPDSVVSKNWQGKHYQLVFGPGNELRLYEDNLPISDSQLPRYAPIIQALKDKFSSQQDAAR